MFKPVSFLFAEHINHQAISFLFALIQDEPEGWSQGYLENWNFYGIVNCNNQTWIALGKLGSLLLIDTEEKSDVAKIYNKISCCQNTNKISNESDQTNSFRLSSRECALNFQLDFEYFV